MSHASHEAKFTARVKRTLKPELSWAKAAVHEDELQYAGMPPPGSQVLLNTYVVVDAKGKLLAWCPDEKTVEVVCELLNRALECLPFHDPDDPDVVRMGLNGEVLTRGFHDEDGSKEGGYHDDDYAD
jgi:hypothetical protein